MPRITTLKGLLFPIAQEALFSVPAAPVGASPARDEPPSDLLSPPPHSPEEAPGRGGSSLREPLRPIPAYNAIVNRDTGAVLGIVSRAYGVVTNAEAVELGRRCCRELLRIDDCERVEVFNVDAPATGTHCYIDLVHDGHAMNLLGNGDKPEIYVPYVRVTNSYNRTRALRFDVGFCRKLCNNGVIFESETIRFSYAHTRDEIRPGNIAFRIADGQIQRLAARFRQFVAHARAAVLDEDASRAIVRSVLGLRDERAVSEQRDARRRLQMLAILNTANATLRRYRAELGPNAYAVFNAMTELARTLGSTPGMYRDTDSMQKLAGAWLAELGRDAKPVERRAA